MGSPRPVKLIKLTKLCEDVICKAYAHPDRRILGAAPRVKETLVHFGYATYTGRDKSGHEMHILTPDGIDRAAPIVLARRVTQQMNASKANERNKTKIKAALFDDIVDALTNPQIGSKTIDLPDGCRIRFDRSGPSKLVVQVTKQQASKT